MKKSLIIGLVSLVTAVASSYGQGFINLDNYNQTGGIITYGANVPANGVSGSFGTVGTGLVSGWTVGVYWALGDITGSLNDPAGNGTPSGLLTLGTGVGSTAVMYDSSFGTPGQFLASDTFQVPGSTAGSVVTLELVCFSGSSYDTAAYRGHSTPFTLTTAAGTATTPAGVGPAFSTFAVTPVTPVPEPSTLALAGLGGFGMLMALRRKKA
jgi:hypothetical protein